MPNPSTQRSVPLQPTPVLLVFALVLGIVSLVVAFFPYVGLPAAILAIIFAVVGHHQNRTKGLWLGGLITGIIGIIIGLFVVGLYILFSGIGATAGNQSYSDAVKEIQSSQRSFTQGETATFGGLDVDVVDVKRTPFETSYAAPRENVVVTLRLALSEHPVGAGVSGSDWASKVTDMTLNGEDPVSTKAVRGSWPRLTTLSEEGPQEVTLSYRIPKASSLTLEYSNYYFTRVSWLVGTEGMPSEDITYTIKLNS